ncbi:MAG TPA: class II fructose-bisphosphate aldolase [Candidatus Choladousia intestinigallinarum]|nr:class II fructose-bisphosphate aldolase [Candidatus Choladousia intestinigallinarum]
MLVNMSQILETAQKEGYGIPCINTPNVEMIRGVIRAAEELNTPVIIDHAQVHDALIPIERIGPQMLHYAREATVPVCVHLDHGSDFNFVMRAIRVGFPSIMYDCSALPFEENLKRVKAFTEEAHGLGITVEAELGVMASTEEDSHGGENRVLTNKDIRKYFTDPRQAAEFAAETGCDALAVCFGTMHGIYAEPPELDIDRVKEIRREMPRSCQVVMHGASGVAFDQVKKAIAAGCTKINYYSYMAKAATEFIQQRIAQSKTTIPYHELQESVVEFIKEYAKEVLAVFRGLK